MKKTLMTHAVAFGGAALMVGGLLVAGAPEADTTMRNRSDNGTMNGRIGSVQQGIVTDGRIHTYGATDESIEPAAGPADMSSSTAPRSNNTYGTTGSNLRRDIEQGR